MTLILTLWTWFLLSLYLPFNRLLKRGYHWKCRWDDRVKLQPLFVFPYLFLYFPWAVGFYGTLFLHPLPFVEQVTLITTLACGIGYFFFWFFPTYVVTPYSTGTSAAHRLLQWLQVADKPFNACPSMHVFLVTLLAIFSSQLWPVAAPVFFGMALLVSISTVLTKRHYIYDVPAGWAVAAVAYGLGQFLLALY